MNNNEIEKREASPQVKAEVSKEMKRRKQNFETLVSDLDIRVETVMRLLQIRYQDAPEAILLKVLAVQAAALGPVIKGEHPSTGEVHVGMPLMFIEHESNNASESLALLFEPIEKFYEKLGGGSAGVSREIIKSNYEHLVKDYEEKSSYVEDDGLGNELITSELKRENLKAKVAPMMILQQLLKNPIYVNTLDSDFISRLKTDSYDGFTTYASFGHGDSFRELIGISDKELLARMMSKRERVRRATSSPDGLSFNPILNPICTVEDRLFNTWMPKFMVEGRDVVDSLYYVACEDTLPMFPYIINERDVMGFSGWEEHIQSFINLREQQARIVARLDVEASKLAAEFSDECFEKSRKTEVATLRCYFRSAPRIALTLATNLRAAQKERVVSGEDATIGLFVMQKAVHLTKWLKSQQIKIWDRIESMDLPPAQATLVVHEEVIKMHRKLKISGPCSKRELFRKYNAQDYDSLEVTLEQAIEMKRVRLEGNKFTAVETDSLVST